MTTLGNPYTSDIYYSNADSTSVSTYYTRLGYSDNCCISNLGTFGNFTGAVITYYNKGQIVSEEQYAFDEENNKKIEEIRKDLQKTKKEYAKKAVYRLTDVDLIDGCLFVNRECSDGHTSTIDVTSDVLNELKNGVKRTVYLSSQVLDFCSEQDPTIFDGWEVVLTDEKADVSLTEMPKNLDGYKDETNEEYLQRIKNKTEEIRHNENAAVIEAESNEEIEQILRRL